MQVFEVEDGMTVQPNCAYIIPPNADMAFLSRTLQLLEPSAARGRRLPIDSFRRAPAPDQHEHAIGIVLSGTGIGTVCVDHRLHILRFTPAATQIISLISSDVGRPVGRVAGLPGRGAGTPGGKLGEGPLREMVAYSAVYVVGAVARVICVVWAGGSSASALGNAMSLVTAAYQILSVCLQFLVWVMPESFRRRLNRNYEPPVATAPAMSEEELMRSLIGDKA